MLKLQDIFTIILLFATWIVISGRLTAVNLGIGFLVAVGIVLVIHSSFTQKLARQVITRFFYFVSYVFLVGWEVITASYKVAYFVLHPKLSCEPGIVKVPTKLGRKDRLIKITILANTITLTPGTVAVDVDTENDVLYVHWMNVQAETPEENRQKITSTFEPLIRRMFG